MAIVKRPNEMVGNSGTDLRYTLTVADGVTSDWLLFGQGIGQVNVDLIPAGTARIETTNDIAGLIADPDSVTGVPWDDGDTTETLTRVSTGVVAFRLVSVSSAAVAHFNAVRT